MGADTTRAAVEREFPGLIEAAEAARRRAYAPHSNFHVGASLLFDDGRGERFVGGCNVESDVYGLTNCAERTAVFAAYANGAARKGLAMIAVVADTPEPVVLCGACRQVLFEQGGPDLRVIMCNTRGDARVATLSELLPGGFRLEAPPKRRAAAATKPRTPARTRRTAAATRRH